MKSPAPLLLLVCATMALSGCSTALHQAGSAPAAPAAVARPATPDAALEALRQGNARFVARKARNRDYLAEVHATSTDQKPFAAVLSCLDSRVPPEIVFDQGIGDLFVARVAGNIENTDILGSLEFATAAKGTPLILVMGHTGCGAVAGACKGVKLGNLTALLKEIQPAVQGVHHAHAGQDPASALFQDEVAEENVRRTIADIRKRSSVIRDLVDAGKVRIAGAMYDLATGQVRFLD